jgi:hypothetical protein
MISRERYYTPNVNCDAAPTSVGEGAIHHEDQPLWENAVSRIHKTLEAGKVTNYMHMLSRISQRLALLLLRGYLH